MTKVFFLDMGRPVRIVGRARDLIGLCGYGDDQIKIEFTGLRPGEKLYEELLADDETTARAPDPKLRTARIREVKGGFLDQLLSWLMQDRVLSDEEVRRELCRCVAE